MKVRTVCWLLALAACGGGGADDAVVVRSAGLELRAALDPATSRVGKNQLVIELRDAAGEPVERAALDVKVEMHAMGAMAAMGGPAHVSELGQGRYRADFALDMGGTWAVEIAAKPASGPAARAEGSVTVGTPGLRLAAVGEAEAPAAERGQPGEFRVAPERLQRIGMRTALVERRMLQPEIRATGRVTWDESALQDVSLKVRGWIGELHADAVGARVERGQVLFTIYSPELYAAQREYLLARQAQARARTSGAPDRADYLVTATANRLRLWDLAPADLERLAARGTPLEQFPIRAPASGYVVEKNVVAGGAVEPGQRLLRIAPLDPVWIEAQVDEEQIPLLSRGMRATIEVPSLPGRRFEGTVAWLYPSVSERTRTAQVRIELPNPDLALQPDAFATVHLETPPSERLVVPLSAVLYAGDRSFVFLDLGEGRLRPQPVEVGLRVGEDVEVLSGVEAGQHVVSSATFLVASESRLRAALDQW